MSNIQTQLANAIGIDNVSTDLPSGIAELLSAKAQAGALPACVALPTTVEDLGKVLALANRNRWRVLPTGQGTKLTWGNLTDRLDLLISTGRLNKILDHAVGDFTVTVQPGLKVSELRAVLAEQGQFLAVDPAFPQQATLGGLVATADTGSLRQRYGGLRDMLIGVQFARYDGALARAGGKVVKNVAGYDLMKLMTGSYGSLGVLSELTFRLYPRLANVRSLILTGPLSALEAAAAEIRLSGLSPIAFDIVSKRVMMALNQSNSHGIVARFQGVAAGVEEQSERLRKIAATHNLGVQQLDGKADTAFWQGSAALIRSSSQLCKVGLKPSSIPSFLALAEQIIPRAQVRLYGSSGLGWVQFDHIDEAASDAGDMTADFLETDVIEKLRSHCEANAGFLTLLQAPKTLKAKADIWGYTGNALGVMSSIKQKFDPHGLLSPGRFVGGL
ncbi:MAG: FAD-binding oxidoreductase [Cyanobacteria bacterium P01_D01_bin.105]